MNGSLVHVCGSKQIKNNSKKILNFFNQSLRFYEMRHVTRHMFKKSKKKSYFWRKKISFAQCDSLHFIIAMTFFCFAPTEIVLNWSDPFWVDIEHWTESYWTVKKTEVDSGLYIECEKCQWNLSNGIQTQARVFNLRSFYKHQHWFTLKENHVLNIFYKNTHVGQGFLRFLPLQS